MAERFREWTEDIQVAGGDLNRTMQDLFKDITVSRIVVRRPNGTKLFELPAAVGLAAGLFLWQLSLIAVGVARLANFRIHVVRRETVPADEDLEVIIEEIIDDTSWPDEPTEDIPIMDSKSKPDKTVPDVGIQVEDFDIIFEDEGDEITIVDDSSNEKTTSDPKPKSPAKKPSSKKAPKKKEPKKEVKKKKAVKIAVEDTGKDTDVDLTVIKGIGPKYQTLLKAAGINSYSALAEMKLDDLRAIFEAAGGRQPKIDTWHEQAKLAAAGEWDKLEKLQSK